MKVEPNASLTNGLLGFSKAGVDQRRLMSASTQLCDALGVACLQRQKRGSRAALARIS